MKRKGRSQIVTIISLILVFIALAISYFFDEASELVTITATLTAVIGVFAVYIQIRKSKLIGQSSFTIEISKYFYEVPGLRSLVHKLGRNIDVEHKEYVVKQSERPILIKYLNYIKTLATLVEEKVLTIETLNTVLAYEFFIVLNNKSVQKLEIAPFANCYYDIFELYYKWTEYRKKRNLEELSPTHALSNLKEYKEYIYKGEAK